jgi:puromycin-sensitive aminopeptidase
MSTTAKKPFQRLPINVLPVNYDVKLTPDLSKFSFDGSVNIDVHVQASTKSIVVNAAELEILNCKFSVQGGSDVPAKVTLQEEQETATFEFDNELPVGKGNLEIAYKGTLNDKMKGFYRTRYTTPWGEERFAAATQFEATDARRALPCWDEPEHKATFDVTLVVPYDRVALSNMNAIKDDRISQTLRQVTFARSPKMSTYLLAFVVGEFDYVEDRDSNGVLIRVYTPQGKSEQGKFALEVAKKTLPFYHKYFNVDYPLPKMDLITIPDFAAGAMENWGLVTYRERYLLVDPSNTSIASKQLVALVVGHELAHQWFGNLVTMKWWTHLWLNEGFATFVEYLCVDHCLGEKFDIWTQFNSQTYSPALKNDALANSHPIEVEVGHPNEVEEIFDMISYSKGASIIRMLHDWIGDENFRKGMNQYLTKFQYSNAETGDLWASLGMASGQPVADIMGTWTEKMGYPVLTVSRKQVSQSDSMLSAILYHALV